MFTYLTTTPAPASSSASTSTQVAPPRISVNHDHMVAEHKASLTALPAGLVGAANKRRRKTKEQHDLTLGNDSRIPWFKPAPGLKVYSITQTLEPVTLLTTSTTLPTYAGRAFIASDLDNFSSFAAVFDQYRIDMIEVLLAPTVTEVTAAASAAGSYISAVDVDDASTPATLGQLGGYPGAQESSGTTCHYHRWKPQYAVAAYSGAFTSYAAATGWLDCGSPNIQYYGLKIASTVTNAVQAVVMYTRYHISFRASH